MKAEDIKTMADFAEFCGITGIIVTEDEDDLSDLITSTVGNPWTEEGDEEYIMLNSALYPVDLKVHIEEDKERKWYNSHRYMLYADEPKRVQIYTGSPYAEMVTPPDRVDKYLVTQFSIQPQFGIKFEDVDKYANRN